MHSPAGFTLLETLMVMSVIGILSAIAVFQLDALRPSLQGDGALRVVMASFNNARDTAIAQRRSVRIDFPSTARLRLTRLEFPSGATVLTDVQFEGGARYLLMQGVGDTPDGFGIASATSFGSALSIAFNTEGALVDSGGNPINGTVFLAVPSRVMSVRAVTIQGTTGRVRGYRWNGRSWTRV
jgi:prepilin-type N-terminal cleavage/methylation domain-containing protein